MKQKKIVESNPPVPLPIPKKTNEISEVQALLGVLKSIKKKEEEQMKKRVQLI